MNTQQPFTTEEIARLRKLLEIEEIRELRVLYAQLMDCSDLDGLANLFAEDALCEFGPYGTWQGRKTIRENYQKVWETNGGRQFHALHANSNHWVELTGPTTAVGRCYLLDIITETPKEENPFVWFGIYDEDYEKTSEGWKIKRSSLQFLWPERHLTESFPQPFPSQG